MCLFKTQKTYNIASEDIECYKVLKSDLRSQYYHWQYELNKLYSKVWDEEFIKYADSHKEIGGNAFHTCLNLKNCEHLYGEQDEKIEIVNTSGEKEIIHNYHFSSDQIVVKCIIPKDSKYYVGIFNEIACEKLYIKEICH